MSPGMPAAPVWPGRPGGPCGPAVKNRNEWAYGRQDKDVWGSGVRRPALFIHLLQGQTQHRTLCPSQAVLGSLLKGFQTSQCPPKNPGQRSQALLFLICLAIPYSGGKD